VINEVERDVLLASAYLHDIGYAPALAVTGCHALDGGRHLRDLRYERLAGLVAYHSGSRFEAELRGLAEELAEFTDEDSALTRLLTYCDMTTGPRGESFTLDERLAEVEHRYGPEHVVTRSLCYAARTWLEDCIAWTEAALRRAEIP
jgi:HD superfamily phosphodiesterase